MTHFLQAEDGPWDLVVHLRAKAGDGFAGKLLDCFYCLSVWIAAPVAGIIGADWRDRLLLWPALSGAAILLERVTQRPASITTPLYTEDPEENHVLLRQPKTTTPQSTTREPQP